MTIKGEPWFVGKDVTDILGYTNPIKTIKRKITDLDAMKITEQKKAVRSGYDMDVIPTDIATYGDEAKVPAGDLLTAEENAAVTALKGQMAVLVDVGLDYAAIKATLAAARPRAAVS